MQRLSCDRINARTLTRVWKLFQRKHLRITQKWCRVPWSHNVGWRNSVVPTVSFIYCTNGPAKLLESWILHYFYSINLIRYEKQCYCWGYNNTHPGWFTTLYNIILIILSKKVLMTSYTKHCNSDSLFNTQLVNTLLYPNLASSCRRCQTLPRVDKHTLYARLSKGHRRITHSIRAARCYFVLKQLSMQERQKLMNQFPTAVIVFALH